MPMIKVWLRKGTTPEYRKAIAGSIQRAMIDVLHIPEDDYFQATYEMDAENYFYDPNYFGLPRSEKFIMVQFSFNARPAAVKQRLFETTAKYLGESPGIALADMGMSIQETVPENWWAHGRAVDPDTGGDARMSAD